jgi:hypothetical protein
MTKKHGKISLTNSPNAGFEYREGKRPLGRFIFISEDITKTYGKEMRYEGMG